MSEKQTRKQFLTNTSKYAVGAAVGVAGLNAFSGSKLIANTTAEWPLPYDTSITPDEARAKGHYLYWNGKDCCSGVFGTFTDLLAEKIGEPWTNIPMEIMLFGRGGGVGWGSLCGTPNGGAAVISAVVGKADSDPLITELWGWYCSTELPTDAANAFDYETKNYEGNLAQSISGSPLCHISVTEWCVESGKKVSDIERKRKMCESNR
ncbi:MAG: C-GCAxxG-C-C family (seleno)protein [Melioribacteraceae bacterium]|nr:C-GCAxxG-C-C family (seleno)protein [Melioribacteraceae bacterium]